MRARRAASLQCGALQQSVEFLGQGALLDSAHALVFQLAVFEEEYGGDVADAEAGGDVGHFFDVGFADGGAAFVVIGNFLHDGGEGFAGATPSGTKIDHDDRIVFQNLVKILFSDSDFHVYV